ncbi:hypothetical protein [Rhizobium sp. RAF56]|uniref:hypothetical protein n=1 Tax=Rhizobium sp. RAF56 TaxID=3233062 RepID=UPI003F999AD9
MTEEQLEPGSMGRLAVLIAEMRALRVGAAELSAGADRLAAEIAEVRRMQLQILNYMAEMLALFSTPPTATIPPVDEVQMPYRAAPEPSAAPAEEIADEPWVDEPLPPEIATAPSTKPKRRAKA